MLKKKMIAAVMAILCCTQANSMLSCAVDFVEVTVPGGTILAVPQEASIVEELEKIKNILEIYIKEEKLSVEPMQIETWDALEDKPIPVEEITLTVGCETKEIAEQIKNFLQEKQIDTSHVFITWKISTFEEPIVATDDLHEMEIMLSNYTLNHGLEAIVEMTETQVKIICQSQGAYEHMVALVEEKQLNQNRDMVVCILSDPVPTEDAVQASDPVEPTTNPVLQEPTGIDKVEILLGNYIRENGLTAHINTKETQIEVVCESQKAYDAMVAFVQKQQVQDIVICTLGDPMPTDDFVEASDPTEPPEDIITVEPIGVINEFDKKQKIINDYIQENQLMAYIRITLTQIEIVCESQEAYDTMLAFVQEQQFNQEHHIVDCILAIPMPADDVMLATELPSDFDMEKHNSIIGGLNRYIKENNISAYACGDTDLRLEQVKVVCKTEEAYQQMQAFIEQEKYNQDDDIVILVMKDEITKVKNPEEVITKSSPLEDDTIDVMDVIVINKVVLGKEVLTETQQKIADVNQDGVVDTNDSLIMLKYIVGLIDLEKTLF